MPVAQILPMLPMIVSAIGKELAVRFSDDRFEAFPDPVDNWIVWDRDEEDFAEVGTHVLRSLPRSQAQAFCSLLNRQLSKAD